MNEYSHLARRALKALMRERNIGTATWRRCAKKAQAIKALETGICEDIADGRESNGALESRITSAVAAALAAAGIATKQTLEITMPLERVVTMSRQHMQFGKLLRMCVAKVNVWMVGPAGSGKTTAAQNVAEAMGLPFFFNGAIDAEHKLLGFVDAMGKIVSRPFRECFENGGVYLFDEVDASMPGALLAFNAALANGQCDFPDKRIERHADCIIIAAGNVYDGPNAEYVGRMKQDKAFMDRFVMLDWPYDEALEMAIAPNVEWTKYVQGVRARVRNHGVKIVVSPRASINGAKLLAAGLDRDEVVKATLRKGLSEIDWARIA